jgi:hypothetical protein
LTIGSLTRHLTFVGQLRPSSASRGETVGLRLDPANCHLFAAADS